MENKFDLENLDQDIPTLEQEDELIAGESLTLIFLLPGG